MDSDWCLTLLNESLECHALHAFPIVVGSGTTSDIRIDDDQMDESQMRVSGGDNGITLENISRRVPITVDGKLSARIEVRPSTPPLLLHVGGTALLVSCGVPDPSLLRSLLKRLGPDVTGWFFLSGTRTVGPVSEADLVAAADDGLLKPSDVVWRTTDSTPVVARNIEGLFASAADRGGPGPESRPQPPSTHKDAMAVCPYCWHHFAPEESLFIAGHPDLMGDLVLGPYEALRFLPTRFTPDGLAIDAGGVICPDTACPRCHLRIPAPILSTDPLILSIVGAPSSGKSYYLASSVWTLRSVLPRRFGLFFTDVDAQTNQWLNEYEDRLFLQADPDAAQGIVKTEQHAAHVYRTVTLDGMQVELSLPCMFQTQRMGRSHAPDRGRYLVLYDNAGEHFQAGQDTAMSPGTQHLGQSEGVLFFFDPSADPRLAGYMRRSAGATDAARVHRQDALLVETISRIRRRLGLGSSARYTKPFLFILSKSDLLGDAIDLQSPAWSETRDGCHALDQDRVAAYSYWCRSLLMQSVPELVYTVESFADHVVFIPVSSLGHDPGRDGVRPADIRPRWVETPLLYMLARSGMVPEMQHSRDGKPVAEVVACDNGLAKARVPGTDLLLDVPVWYCGRTLFCPYTGTEFVMPDRSHLPHRST